MGSGVCRLLVLLLRRRLLCLRVSLQQLLLVQLRCILKERGEGVIVSRLLLSGRAHPAEAWLRGRRGETSTCSIFAW